MRSSGADALAGHVDMFAIRPAAVVLAFVAGCGEIVIGTYPGSDEASGTGDGGPPLPGGCVVEPFDDGFDADVWVTWADGDAATAPTGGTLAMIPPSAGLVGTGLVLNNQWAFELASAHVRVEVIAPPDPASTTELFLQVTQQGPSTMANLSFGLFQGGARVRGHRDDGSEAFAQPVLAAYPRWIGIRTADGRVHFETSDDGVAWASVASFDLPAAFPGATPLVMAWNNEGFASTPQAVVVDALEICAD